MLCPSRNLPMTTREPISDAKARELLLPSSSWGSHRYRRSSYREGPRALGYIAYIRSVHGKKRFLGRGTSDWSLYLKDCVLVSDWSLFLKVKSGDSGLGSDWLVGGGVRSGDFQRLLDFQRLFSQNLTEWSFSVNKME